ncbi:hypothetical protein [Crocinitomix catalasitica]|uniref:hypothetical protein n=1 Tax=Crocinitomix catalasitica TaxID=184607 RepID=UPI0004859AE1|nr:hypothetical protein [Crocinitomix catalasitica]
MKKLFITMSLMAFLGGFTMNSYAQEGEKKSEATKTTKESKKTTKTADSKTKTCAEKACCKKGGDAKKTATPKATK